MKTSSMLVYSIFYFIIIDAAAYFPPNIVTDQATPPIGHNIVGLFCLRTETPSIIINAARKRVKVSNKCVVFHSVLRLS
jgi:hypothetical protein